MSNLAVVTVWTKSDTYATKDWALKVQSMVQRWCNRKFSFFCITDSPEDFALSDEVFALTPTIKPPKDVPKWWYKVNLFCTDWSGYDRVFYLDLDVAIMGSLYELLDFPSSFCTAPSNGVPMNRHDFNSSVIMFDPASEQLAFIRAEMDKGVPYRKFAGDQQWLSSLPMRVDLFPSRWIHKYLPGNGVYTPPAGTKIALLIQGGKNLELIKNGHKWLERLWI